MGPPISHRGVFARPHVAEQSPKELAETLKKTREKKRKAVRNAEAHSFFTLVFLFLR